MTAGRLPASAIVLAGIPALLLSIAAAVTLGPADLSVADVGSVVGHRLGLVDTEVSRIGQGIVLQLRLPRALLAAICGAGLGVCGAVLQTLVRNPLADPYLLGVSSGASTGAVSVVVLGLGAGAIGLTAGA
ncbi:iron chelate uptake ABC transporter family permease subunit, partial [Saccharopolyspora sp. 6V]|uniref:iron chelate uptake ABC transporter family permease subunit n=1 Tax=Saccharopolyspora sp. 6V TaxID=2877239 RepID=UPI001CD42C00